MCTQAEIKQLGDANLAQLINRAIDEMKKRKGAVEAWHIIITAFSH